MNKYVLSLILAAMTTFATFAQIAEKWAQHTVHDTVDVPIEAFWPLSFEVNLEEIASMAKYQDLPKIVSTSPGQGDFTEAGHSRRVHFASGQTLLESILVMEPPRTFVYELTEIEIPLKRVAKRARGHFEYVPTSNGKTAVRWTYGFDQKNFVAKWLINGYIRRTHRYWMKDTLTEMKRQIESKYRTQ